METIEHKLLSKPKLVVGTGLFMLGLMFFPAISIGVAILLMILRATKKPANESSKIHSAEPILISDLTLPAQSTNTEEVVTSEPKIGGFLLLVGCWMLMWPLLTTAYMGDYLRELPREFLEGLNQIPITSSYPVVLIGSILVGTLVLYIAAAIAFFKKSKIFPKFFITLLVGDFVLNLGFTVATVGPGDQLSSSDVRDLIKAGIFATFWTFVFLRSERVKNTFVKSDSTVNFLMNRRSAVTLATLVITMPLLVLVDGKISSGYLFNTRKDQNHLTEKNSADAKSTTEIAKMSLESLVVVESFDKRKKKIKTGSGFYFFEDDLIVTNYHVISGASYILFRKANAKEDDETSYNYIRDLVAIDRDSDIAVVRTERKSKNFLSPGKSSDLEIGETIYVAGNPRGLEGTFSDGLLSNRLNLDGINHLQITAPISSGSSGGPLLNKRGEVVGIVSASFKKGQNLNLAIPSYYVFAAIQKEIDEEESHKNLTVTTEIVEKGHGRKAVSGDRITVHYVGMLPDKTIFDNSVKRDRPFTFTLGAGQVIAGWDQGIVGMQVGEYRILNIPAELAYGSKSVGKIIPPNSALTFAIRLLEINSSNAGVGH